MLSATLAGLVEGVSGEIARPVERSSTLPAQVLEFFAQDPNRFTRLPSDIKMKVRGTGVDGEVTHIAPEHIPQSVREVQAQMKSSLADSKEEFEVDANSAKLEADLAKSENREPRFTAKFKGFDGGRLIITDILEEDGIMVIEVAKATYSLRAAAAKVATEIANGARNSDELIVDGKMFQPCEFHAGSLIFLENGFQIAQVKGLADGQGTIHLNASGGGVEWHHLQGDAVKEGADAEILEEIGNVAKYGLKTRVIGKNDERIALNSTQAITNYAGIMHELVGDKNQRLTLEQFIEIAKEQFGVYSEQTLPSGEKKGLHLWEVTGYPIIDYTKPESFFIHDGKLYIETDVIRPTFDAAGVYTGVEIKKEGLQVQGTIAPQITYYAKFWEEQGF